MAAPTTLVRVDWYANDPADFTPAICTVDPISRTGVQITRGRSGDFSGDATGQLTFALDNSTYKYSPDRNWFDNGSFEVDTSGWSTTAITSLTAAATSITKTTDAPSGAGSSCGAAVLTSTLNSGVSYAIPYRFRSGVTYSFSVSLKSASGTLNVRAGLASAGTPTDIATTSTNITTGWVTYSGTWTPSADRTDAVFFVRTNTNSAATVRIDAVQVNPGSSANAYIEAPTKGQLVPGRPIHVQATYSATVYPLFFGYIETLTVDPLTRLCTITAYDPLARMGSRDGFVPAVSELSRCGRDFRIAALEDFARGGANLMGNPDFATDTTGWSAYIGGAISRITTDGARGSSSCLQVVASALGDGVRSSAILVGQLFDGQSYRLSAYLKSASGNTSITMAVGATTQTFTITSSWARYSMAYVQSGTVGSSSAPTILLTAGGAATFKVDAVAFTRGEGLYPYAASGRATNFVANGGFDVGTTGWDTLWANLVTNPSFESNTTGWANETGTTPDGYTQQNAIAIGRSTSYPAVGTYSLLVQGTGATLGADRVYSIASYAFTGLTFKSGVAYTIRFYATQGVGGLGYWSFGVSGDYVGGSITSSGSWITTTWTPSADRTGVKVYITARGATLGNDSEIYVDAFCVTRQAVTEYWGVGPFGTVSTTAPTIATSTSSPKYGYQAMTVAITAANQGAGYDFTLTAPKFSATSSYTASVWLKSSSGTATVTLGLGYADTSTTDQATTSASVGTSWTQVTVTWTPSADRSAATAYRAYVWIKQTGSGSRTLSVDGVRVEPGASASDYELAQWAGLSVSGAEVTTALPATAKSTDTTLGALNLVNKALMSRHWISALAASPWWQYNSASRDIRPALAEAVITDAQLINSLQADRSVYVTSAPVQYLSGGSTATYIGASESAYSLIAQSVVATTGGSQWTPSLSEAQSIAAEILARYGSGHLRPTILVANRWPSQLQRDCNDIIAVTISNWKVGYFVGSIERITTTITDAGQKWSTVWQLDEWVYAV